MLTACPERYEDQTLFFIYTNPMKNKEFQSVFIISVMAMGHFWHDIFTAMVTPLLPVIKETWQVGYTEIGLLPVALRIPSLFSAFIGQAAERIKLKYFIIFCPLLTAASISFIGLSPSFSVLLIMALAAGFSAACFHVPVPTLLKQTVSERTGIAMSAFQIGGEAARTLGPAVALAGLSLLGFKGMYKMVWVSLAVSICYLFLFRKIDGALPPKGKQKGSLLQTIKEGKFLYLLITGITLQKSVISTVIRNYLPLYLKENGAPLWLAGGSLSLVQGAAVAGLIVTGLLTDRVGRKPVLKGIVILSSLLMIFFPFSSGAGLYILLVLIGFVSFSSMPIIYSLIQDRGFTHPVTANGVFISLNFGISSLFILLAGRISDLMSIQATYSLFAVLSLVGIPFLFLLKKKFQDI